VAAIFGVVVAALGGYSYYRSRISWSELTFLLVGAAAVFAYAIAGAGTFLSAPQFVSELLAGLAGLAFIGLFLYWAYSQADETSD
jgi:drug/metabolite transporter (DMT)-like permease